nr:MAG TPA: hypothetical protein [Microviridae sp.]
MSRCIFYLYSCSLLCGAKRVSHLARFHLSRPRLAKVTPIKMQNMLYNI